MARDAAPRDAARVSFAAARGRVQGPLRRSDARVAEGYADWCEYRRRCVPTPPRRVHLSFASEGKRDPSCRLARLTCSFPSDLEESYPPTHLPTARPHSRARSESIWLSEGRAASGCAPLGRVGGGGWRGRSLHPAQRDLVSVYRVVWLRVLRFRLPGGRGEPPAQGPPKPRSALRTPGRRASRTRHQRLWWLS